MGEENQIAGPPPTVVSKRTPDVSSAGLFWGIPQSGWVYEQLETTITSDIVLSDGVAYFGDDGGNFHGVDVETGESVFKNFTSGYGLKGIAVGENVAVGADSRGELYVLDTETGEELHTVSADAMRGGAEIVGDVGVAGDDSGTLTGVDINTGEKVINTNISSVYLRSQTAADSERVFLGDKNGVVYGFNVSSNNTDWTFSTGGRVTQVALHGGVLYVGSEDSRVYAIDPADGSEIWNTSLSSGVRGGIGYDGDDVYVGHGQRAASLDAETGGVNWDVGISPNPSGKIRCGSGRVFIQAVGGVVSLLSADGSQEWAATTADDSNIDSGLAAGLGSVYTGWGDSFELRALTQSVGTLTDAYELRGSDGSEWRFIET